MDRVRNYTDECLQLRPTQVLRGVGGRPLVAGARYGVAWPNGSAVSMRCVEIDDAGGVLRLGWAEGVPSGVPVGHALCFERTPCGSGSRAWWLCPACSKRCGVVYLRFERFACRKCQQLHYRSQSLKPLDRAFRALDKAGARIDPKADADGWIDRPAGMHWTKYARLTDAHGEARWRLCQERKRSLFVGARKMGIR